MASVCYTRSGAIVCVGTKIVELSRNETGELQQGCLVDIASLKAPVANTTGENGNADANKQQEVTVERKIVNATVSRSGQLLGVITSAKELGILRLDGLRQVGQLRALPKAPTSLAFTNDERHVIVADKAGSARRYSTEEELANVNTDELLGHLSILLDVCFSEDGLRLLTSDRDEKIRISRYPQTSVIEQFCLGHTAYVRTIATRSSLVASAGGDGYVRLWDLYTGKELGTIGLQCSEGIRKLRLLVSDKLTRIVVLPEKASYLANIDYDYEKSTLSEAPRTTVCEADELLDFDVDSCSQRILCVGRRGLYEHVAGTTRAITVSEELASSLHDAKDFLAREDLVKNVAFNNMEAYKQRKEERESRKRKLSGEESNATTKP